MSAWRQYADATIRSLAASGQPFTSDDLIDRVGPPDPEHEANAKNNAVGAVFREAAAAGLIVSDGRVVKSRQPHRKGGAIRVWRGSAPPQLGLFG